MGFQVFQIKAGNAKMNNRLPYRTLLIPAWWLLTLADIVLTLQTIRLGAYEVNVVANSIGFYNFILLKLSITLTVSSFIARDKTRLWLAILAVVATMTVVLWNGGILYMYGAFGNWFWLHIAK